jgi:hypothetical protein
MRALGRLIAFLGLISLLAGGYGFAIMHTSYAPVLTGWVAEAYMYVGGFGYSLRHPEFLLRGLQAFTVTYRMGLALGGLGGTIVGALLMKR